MVVRGGWWPRRSKPTGRKLRRLFARVRIEFLNIGNRTLVLALLAFLFFLYVLYTIFSAPMFSHDHYDSQLERLTNTDRCQPLRSVALQAFEMFVRRTVAILDMLEIKHFLCYETLWTALRRANREANNIKKDQLRITDACFNLCVLNEDIVRHDESIIVRRFRNDGINIDYIHSDGLYILKPTTRLFGDASGDHSDDVGHLHPILFSIHGRIHVFENDSNLNMYRRVGWRSRILPSTMCKQLHCFPTDLVSGDRPLPKLQLSPSLPMFNVPREGLEIQKYHYPDTWWNMEDSVADCENL